MKTKSVFFLILSSLIISCTNTKIVVNKNNLNDSLGIHLVNGANIDENDFKTFTDATNQFINTFNSEQHRFELFYSQIDSNSVNINIASNKYVTTDKQAIGAIVTVLGVATFVVTASSSAGFYLIFWYNPHNQTIVNVSLSKEIDPSMKQYVRVISTRHKFQSLEKQKEKQKDAYFELLKIIMNEIESSSN